MPLFSSSAEGEHNQGDDEHGDDDEHGEPVIYENDRHNLSSISSFTQKEATWPPREKIFGLPTMKVGLLPLQCLSVRRFHSFVSFVMTYTLNSD